ncbi:MAG: sulfoxide reductase heme-binding subunit YedZ [Deltaproteobacteria bacterium]|nr:sulfoxide reductase heme-binding subunit YedZ [Deltaproteobacteria bacterium]
MIKGLLFLASLGPLAWLALNGYAENLGANPIEVITRTTGTWTLVFLLITLSITPLRKFSGWHWLIRLRRMFGLFAFFYASLHFTTYIWLDQFFDLQSIIKDVMKRPFITVGFSSFMLLVPLALTSSSAMIRRLGKGWQQLHRLVYVIAIGGVVHFMWLVKADRRQPLIYGTILTFLLGYRLLARWYAKRRLGLVSGGTPVPFRGMTEL